MEPLKCLGIGGLVLSMMDLNKDQRNARAKKENVFLAEDD